MICTVGEGNRIKFINISNYKKLIAKQFFDAMHHIPNLAKADQNEFFKNNRDKIIKSIKSIV